MDVSLGKSGNIIAAILVILLIIYYMFKHFFDRQGERFKYILYYYYLRIKNMLF